MKISVIIPTYNRAGLIRETLDSLQHQTRLPDEIIVADDGSTDQTAEIVKAYGTQVTYLSRPRIGHCAVRNAGWATSTGDALCFLDSDDILLPEALAELEEALDANPNAAVAYCRSQIINADSSLRDAHWKIPDYQGPVWSHLVHGNFIRSPGCVLIRRVNLESAGPWNVSLKNNVDWDIWLRLAEKSPFVRVDAPLFQYRIHAGNLSGDPAKMYPGALRMFRTHLARHASGSQEQREIAQAMQGLRKSGTDHLLRQIHPLRANREFRSALKVLQMAIQLRPELIWDHEIRRLLVSTYKLIIFKGRGPREILWGKKP